MIMQNKKSYHRLLLALCLLFVLFVASCKSTSQTIPAAKSETAGCNTKECFISAANNCNEASLTFSEDIGVIKYSSSKGCVFTKTIVSVSENETPEMNKLL